MKNIILIFLSASSVGLWGMDKELFPMGQCPRLTVVNNHTKKIVVRYQPLLPGMDEASSLIPASLGTSIIPIPRVTTMYTEVTVAPEKKTELKQLLVPCVTIKIDGFHTLENVRILRSDVPLVINTECDNEIKVTQDEQERAIIKSLHLSIQARSSKKYKKENSDEDCCAIQ
jgi:hypothetical protein